MNEINYPFPDRILARQELARDRMCHKIPPALRPQLCDEAWRTGCEAAGRALGALGPGPGLVERLLAASGLRVEQQDRDQVAAGQRIFAEYSSREHTVCLYTRSIGRYAAENGLAPAETRALILAHEYFHFLESTSLGQVSGRYTVPCIQIGPFRFGRSGVQALSEIAAHGFARTCWEAERKQCLGE